MNNEYYGSDENSFQEAYFESLRDSLAPAYGQRLSTAQIEDVVRGTLESLPPMEREAFADMSLRNTTEFWPALIPLIAPLIPKVVDLIKPKTQQTRPPAVRPPAVSPPAARPPEPMPDPIASQIAAVINNPQFLQAVAQALGSAGIAIAPVQTATVKTNPQEDYSYTIKYDNDSYDDDSYDENSAEFSLGSAFKAIGSVAKNVIKAPFNVAGKIVNTVASPLIGGLVGGPLGAIAGTFAGKPSGTSRPPVRYAPPPQIGPYRDPRYWYYDHRFRQWRRRQGYPPPPPLVNQPFGPGNPLPPAGEPFAPGVPPDGAAPAWGAPAVPTPEPTPNTAASQLLALINNPQFSQAMTGQVLGDIGSGNATLQHDNGLVDIPFGALMNTLVELGQQAAEESVRMGGEESEKYLMDNAGNYRVDDPSNPEEKANLVMDMFRQDFEWRTNRNGTSQAEFESQEAVESYDPVTAWLISAGMVR